MQNPYTNKQYSPRECYHLSRYALLKLPRFKTLNIEINKFRFPNIQNLKYEHLARFACLALSFYDLYIAQKIPGKSTTILKYDKCDQICQKGSYIHTVPRHTFHHHSIATSLEQQYMCVTLSKDKWSALLKEPV